MLFRKKEKRLVFALWSVFIHSLDYAQVVNMQIDRRKTYGNNT